MAALPEPSREAAERLLREEPAPIPRAVSVAKPVFESRRIDLGEREAVCPQHGKFLSKGLGIRLTDKVREVWQSCPDCEADRVIREASEAAAAEALERRKAAQRMLDCAAIPARFQDRSFDTFKASTPAQQHALDVARAFADDFDSVLRKGSGLVMAGQPGTGKSHLAASILLALAPRHAVLYTTCMGAIRMVRDTWRKDAERSEMQVLRALGQELDLLVIDEVGVQYGTDGEQTILFEILDRRYSAKRPTILLTNQDRAGFRQFVGDRVLDRLRETARWVPFDWSSYRAHLGAQQ